MVAISGMRQKTVLKDVFRIVPSGHQT